MSRRFHAPTIVRGLLIALLVVAMVACGGDDEPAAEDAPATEAQQAPEEEGGKGAITIDGQEANDHGEEDVTGVATVEMEADDFYFEPTILTGDAGQKVTLHVTNEGDSPHNFSITDQDIDENLDPGDDVDVKVTFPESGTVVFFCSFHQGGGMLGALEVAS
jgi:plastocyanin